VELVFCYKEIAIRQSSGVDKLYEPIRTPSGVLLTTATSSRHALVLRALLSCGGTERPVRLRGEKVLCSQCGRGMLCQGPYDMSRQSI
jgi:hypothetical protein